jgi:GntR family transcriptional regulator
MPLPTGRITRGSRSSLQEQILRALLKDIESGHFSPGDRLPTERQIADAMGASLAPVRVALKQLELAGYIERTQGRGTFVVEKPVHYELRLMSSTTESLRSAGVEFQVEVVDQSVASPPVDVGQKLGAGADDEAFHLLRVVSVRSTPSILLESWIGGQFMGELVGDEIFDRGGSLYDVLRKNGVVQARATGEVRIHNALDWESDLLGIPFGAPLLALNSSTYTPDGQVIDVSRGLYDSSRFAFELDRTLDA